MIRFLVGTYGFLIFSVPIVAAGAGPLLAESTLAKLGMLLLAAPIYAISFITVAGLLSRFTAKAMIPGVFTRELSDPVYGPRRLWALCWTAVYYFTPLYFVCVTFAPLRSFLFRIFGYKGALKFTLAPDVWIRDLPLLNFGNGSYIANLATLGTNICMPDNKTFVQGIKIGERSMVGHKCIVGPGVKMAEDVETGINTMVGIRTRMGKGSKLAPRAALNHGCDVHENVDIGSDSYVGLRAIIFKGIRIPAGANIPAGAKIEKQEDVDAFITSETIILKQARADGLARMFESASPGATGPGGKPLNEVA